MWAVEGRPEGEGGRSPSGVRGRGQGPPGGIRQDSPSLLSDPGRGKVLLIARPVPHPLAPPLSPDLLHLITWVFYLFFPCESHRGTEAGSESPGPGPGFHLLWSLVLAPTLPEDPRTLRRLGPGPGCLLGASGPAVSPGLQGVPTLTRAPGAQGERAPWGPNGAASSLQCICNSWLQQRLH